VFGSTCRHYICNGNALLCLVRSVKSNLFSPCLPHVPAYPPPINFLSNLKHVSFFPFLLPDPVDGVPPSYSRSTKIMDLLILPYYSCSPTTSSAGRPSSSLPTPAPNPDAVLVGCPELVLKKAHLNHHGAFVAANFFPFCQFHWNTCSVHVLYQ
jgi:hypothetical protein